MRLSGLARATRACFIIIEALNRLSKIRTTKQVHPCHACHDVRDSGHSERFLAWISCASSLHPAHISPGRMGLTLSHSVSRFSALYHCVSFSLLKHSRTKLIFHVFLVIRMGAIKSVDVMTCYDHDSTPPMFPCAFAMRICKILKSAGTSIATRLLNRTHQFR